MPPASRSSASRRTPTATTGCRPKRRSSTASSARSSRVPASSDPWLRRREPRAEPCELLATGAEVDADLAGPQVVAVDRVVDVYADAAVQVLRRVGDVGAAFGGPELRDRQLVGGVLTLLEQMERAPGGEAHGLEVHVGVARAGVDGLERAHRAVELLALCDVARGDLERALRHAHLHGAQAEQ